MHPSSAVDRPATPLHGPGLRALVLLLLCLLVIGYNLGGNSLHNDDEAKHAVVAREAAVDGHWLPLTYIGRPYYSKPPLRIWLTAATFRWAGISEWTVRVWSGIFAAATVLALYLLGRRIWNERIGFSSALILLTSHQFIYNHCARTGETDSMLIFCWTAGLLLLQLAVQRMQPGLLYLAAGLLGLCGMVKHLGFVPIVLIIAVAYVLLSGGWREFPARTWLASLALVAAVALPWHLAMWWLKGKTFLDAYFVGEVVERRLQAGPKAVTWTTPGQYVSLATTMRGFFPWSFLLPCALVDVFGKKSFRRDWLLPVLWMLVALLTTVISGRKFTWYVLPAFPPAAILVARLVDRFLARSSTRFVRLSILLGGLAALASQTDAATLNPFGGLARQTMLSVRFLGRLRGPEAPLLPAVVLLLLLTGIAMLTLRLVQQSGKSTAGSSAIRAVVLLCITGLALYTVVVPLRFSRHRSQIHQLAAAAEQHLDPGETLYVCLPRNKTRNPRYQFYFGAGGVDSIRADALARGEFAGKLVLTDWPTLGEVGMRAPLETLTQSGGQVLLRWPER